MKKTHLIGLLVALGLVHTAFASEEAEVTLKGTAAENLYNASRKVVGSEYFPGKPPVRTVIAQPIFCTVYTVDGPGKETYACTITKLTAEGDPQELPVVRGPKAARLYKALYDLPGMEDECGMSKCHVSVARFQCDAIGRVGSQTFSCDIDISP